MLFDESYFRHVGCFSYASVSISQTRVLLLWRFHTPQELRSAHEKSQSSILWIVNRFKFINLGVYYEIIHWVPSESNKKIPMELWRFSQYHSPFLYISKPADAGVGVMQAEATFHCNWLHGIWKFYLAHFLEVKVKAKLSLCLTN
jgi:hypothetical protein